MCGRATVKGSSFSPVATNIIDILGNINAAELIAHTSLFGSGEGKTLDRRRRRWKKSGG